MPERERALNVRTTVEEMQMIEELAEARGLSISALIRTLVRQAHVESFGPAKRPKSRR